MKIEILTLFPHLFSGFVSSSIIKRACETELLSISTLNFRDFAEPPHFHTDDLPYGGGAGMVLKPEPLVRAVQNAKERLPNAKVVLFSASGTRFTQSEAERCAQESDYILICGRYEGVDQRVIDICVDQEYSIGDFVMMGGEVPAMAFIEAVTRLKENVLGNEESLSAESFTESVQGMRLLEAPHYTRPAQFENHNVPDVLLSGDHKRIAAWREEHSLRRTRERRPELLENRESSNES